MRSVFTCLYDLLYSRSQQGELCQGSYIIQRDDIADDLKKKHFFLNSTVSNPLSGKWEAFINDGRHIMYIAQIIETLSFPKDAIIYIHGITKNDEDAAFMNRFYDMYYHCKNRYELSKLYEKSLLRFLHIVMSHDAKVYERRTFDSILYWKRKFIDVYGNTPVFDELASNVEWEWNEVW